jgi:hypothetical protein
MLSHSRWPASCFIETNYATYRRKFLLDHNLHKVLEEIFAECRQILTCSMLMQILRSKKLSAELWQHVMLEVKGLKLQVSKFLPFLSKCTENIRQELWIKFSLSYISVSIQTTSQSFLPPALLTCLFRATFSILRLNESWILYELRRQWQIAWVGMSNYT